MPCRRFGTRKGFRGPAPWEDRHRLLEDYWLREGEKQPTGDHIDLWRLDRLTPSYETTPIWKIRGAWCSGESRDRQSDMKRVSFILFAVVLGTTVGLAAATLGSFFVPACGEDCSNRIVGQALAGLGLGWLVFVPAAVWASRHGVPTARRWFPVAMALVLLMLGPALTYHVFSLHAEYRRLQEWAPVRPTTDFFHMAIAVRAVQGVSDAHDGPTKPVATIPAWERCLIGADLCDTSPRQVEVLCKAGTVHVNEADWSAFALIPAENAPGVPPLSSMDRCKGG